jgi:hypothetical protein
VQDVAAGSTDLVLAAVLLGCAEVLRRAAGLRRSWSVAFAAFGAAAAVGAAHHLVLGEAPANWLLTTVLVALAISALLAASAGEVVEGPVARALLALRVAGLGAYALSVALGGIGGTLPLVLCESVTMLAVVGLWAYAARAGHPAALRVLVAIAACAAPSVFYAFGSLTDDRGVGAASLQHLTQIPGVLLLCAAALTCASRPVTA